MILFIADKADGGGAENQMLEELTILSKYFEILLLTKYQPKNDTLSVLEQNSIQFLGSIDNNVSISLVKQFDISLIHVHNIWHLETQKFIQELNFKPIVMTIHDYRILCPTGWKVQPNENVECMQRSETFCPTTKCFTKEHANNTNASLLWFSQYFWLKQNINGYAIVNKHLFQRMAEDGFTNLHNVPYPLNKVPDFFNNFRHKQIIFAGIFAEHKGIIRFIKTIKQLISIDKYIEVVIIGEGNMEVAMKKELLNFTNIQFLDKMKIDNLYKEFSKSAVVYLPSKWCENFNLIGRYARLIGTPILVPKTSGFLQRLNKGISEFYFPTESNNDAVQLKNMIDKVVSLQKGSLEDREDEIEQS